MNYLEGENNTMISSKFNVWHIHSRFINYVLTERGGGKGWSMTKHADTLSSLKAADKNTNEGSQVENVSTVVLIDLTDTSGVSCWKKLVAWHFAQAKWVCHSLLSDSLKFPSICSYCSLCFVHSHSLNIISPLPSFTHPSICHSV